MKATILVFLTTLATAAPALADDDAPIAGPSAPAAPAAPAAPGKARLGVAIVEIGADLRAHLGAPADRGVLVDGVRADSPAARAGLRTGDVILDVDGDPTSSTADVRDAIATRNQGDVVTINVLRDGKRTELRATLDSDRGPQPPRFDRFDQRPRPFERFDRRHPFERFDRDASPFEHEGDELEAPSGTWFPNSGRTNTRALQRALDEAHKRIDALERRLERLERPRT
jgi:membrane-associated protease RseP (regulator of RpoE activity)